MKSEKKKSDSPFTYKVTEYRGQPILEVHDKAAIEKNAKWTLLLSLGTRKAKLTLEPRVQSVLKKFVEKYGDGVKPAKLDE